MTRKPTVAAAGGADRYRSHFRCEAEVGILSI